MINEYYLLKQGEKEGPYTHIEIMDMEIEAYQLILSPLMRFVFLFWLFQYFME
jgi:hypothetical protein